MTKISVNFFFVSSSDDQKLTICYIFYFFCLFLYLVYKRGKHQGKELLWMILFSDSSDCKTINDTVSIVTI